MRRKKIKRAFSSLIEKEYKYAKIEMKKLKLIIEVVKFKGIIAHLLEAFDYIESFIKRRTQQKPNPVGFKTEE